MRHHGKNMDNKFVQKLATMDREVKALKTAQRIPSLIRGDSYSFQIVADGQGDTYSNGMYHYRVTYGDGPQPIMSEFYCEGLAWAKEPVNNSQDVYFWAQISNTCNIMSTRKILSVQKIV